MIEIDGRMAWTAMHFVNDEAPGTALHGFLVEPTDEGAFIVAADGRRMVVMWDRSAKIDRSLILRLDPEVNRRLVPLSKLVISLDGIYGVRSPTGRSAAWRSRESCILGLGDGYPNWRRVVDSATGTYDMPPVYVDFDQLASFHYLWSEFRGTGQERHVRINQYVSGAILLRNHETDRFGILMPVADFLDARDLPFEVELQNDPVAEAVAQAESHPPEEPPLSDEAVEHILAMHHEHETSDIYEGSGLPDPEDVTKKD